MRVVAAILLGSAAIDWPTLWLDRAGVALLGVAAIALTLPARGRPGVRVLERPARPAIFDELDELEPELAAEADRVVSLADTRSRA